MTPNRKVAIVAGSMTLVAFAAVLLIVGGPKNHRSPSTPESVSGGSDLVEDERADFARAEGPLGTGTPATEDSATSVPDPMVKVLAYKIETDGFGNVTAYVLCEPLTREEHQAIAKALKDEMQKRHTPIVPRIWFFYAQDHYRYQINNRGKHWLGVSASYQAVREGSEWRQIDLWGFYPSSDDPAVVVQQWAKEYHGGITIAGVAFDSSSQIATLECILFTAEGEDREGRWNELMQHVEAVWGSGLPHHIWAVIPGLKGVRARFLDKDGNRIAEISGDREAHLRIAAAYHDRYGEYDAILRAELDASLKHQAGILTDESYRLAEEESLRRENDWYTRIWLDHQRWFQVHFVDDEWRRL